MLLATYRFNLFSVSPRQRINACKQNNIKKKLIYVEFKQANLKENFIVKWVYLID